VRRLRHEGATDQQLLHVVARCALRGSLTLETDARDAPCSSPSAQILQPILTAQMKAHPAWASWLKLVELFTYTLQYELKVDDVKVIDNLQLQHSALFDAVPEYNGLKRPKHHFCTHLADDIYRYGPPRGFWCFGFEGFNRIIKRGARMSNWKNTTVSIMQYWSARSARALMRL